MTHRKVYNSKEGDLMGDGKFSDPVVADPGCFVWNGTHADPSQRLRFGCEDDDCYGHGYNFGSWSEEDAKAHRLNEWNA